MMPPGLLLLLSFVTALVVSGLVLRAGILDHPNSRSNHVNPTPRGGGLGIVVAVLAALALIPVDAPADQAALAGIALCTLFVAGLGLIDDLVVLKGGTKFPVLAVLSLALAGMAGPVTEFGISLPWLAGLIGSALFVFTLANAVNFMDGSDGLMAAGLIPAASALGVLAEGPVALAAFALAAAVAGFAVWNAPLVAPRGKLFSGDVGSLGAATIFAGLALAWASTGPIGSVWLVPLLVLPLLGDVLLTMAARVRAGCSPFRPHRAHAYQLLIAMGLSHRRVALLWGAMSVACGALALLAANLPAAASPISFGLATIAFMILHRYWRRRAGSNGLDIYQ